MQLQVPASWLPTWESCCDSSLNLALLSYRRPHELRQARDYELLESLGSLEELALTLSRWAKKDHNNARKREEAKRLHDLMMRDESFYQFASAGESSCKFCFLPFPRTLRAKFVDTPPCAR